VSLAEVDTAAARTPRFRRAFGLLQHRRAAPYLFISPFYLLYAAFLLGPTVFAIYLSFHEWDGITAINSVGLRNYRSLFADPSFVRAAENTAIYSASALFLLCPLALALALALNSRGVVLKDMFRLIYFMPIVVSPVVIAIMFLLIFDQQYGLLNGFLHGLLGMRPVAWLSTPSWAKVAIIIVILWRYTGYIMIFFLAGLQAIPLELREAARVAGANSWQELRYVTLPLLRPITAFISVVVLIGAAQIFEEPYILTQGGPQEGTLSVAQFVYREGLTNLRLGYASAASVILFLVVFIFTYSQIVLFRIGREDV
jgi:multiple sugar transport system permease protein